tara:strand:+ start:4456 stop:5169 length:714 start_codon:yes stop_codon:yes gene_type:complete
MWIDLKKFLRGETLNVFLLTTFFFFGCSLSVPEPDENNQTLLIIPVETIQTLKKFIYTVNFTIEDSSGDRIPYRIEPNPDTFFSYKSQLKPGKYKLSKLQAIANPGFRVGKKKKQRIRDFEKIEFKLEKGKAIIIDKKLLIQQPERITGNYMKILNRGERKHEIKIRKKKIEERNKDLKKKGFRNVQMIDLDNTFKEKLMKELKEVENIGKWEIIEQKTTSSQNSLESSVTSESDDY